MDVFFKGSANVRWTDNLFLDEKNEESDTIFTFSPGLEVNVGRGVSAGDLTIITRYDIIRYDEFDDLDTERFHIKAIGSYNTSRLDLNGYASFDEEQYASSSSSVGKHKLVESDNVGAGANAEYRFSPKFSFGAGLNYTDKNYDDDDLADRTTYRVPLDLFYELTPKIDLSVGYIRTDTEISSRNVGGIKYGSYDTDSNFFNVGMRGDLLPKLSGFFKVGYTESNSDSSTINGVKYDRGSDDSMLGLDANFTYAATPKLTTTLGLNRSFGTADEGDGTENTGGDLGATYSINSYFAASGNLSYLHREYTESGREDDRYGAGLRLSYTPNQYWRFSGGYRYADNDSDRRGESYTSNNFDLSASLRY